MKKITATEARKLTKNPIAKFDYIFKKIIQYASCGHDEVFFDGHEINITEKKELEKLGYSVEKFHDEPSTLKWRVSWEN